MLLNYWGRLILHIISLYRIYIEVVLKNVPSYYIARWSSIVTTYIVLVGVILSKIQFFPLVPDNFGLKVLLLLQRGQTLALTTPHYY